MKFLYGFGFETPDQRARNAARGWDDEDSGCVFIEAATAGAALEWGRAVAEAFLKHLYDDPAVSWAADGYADWIESDPASRWSPEQLANVPTVSAGEMPDLTRVASARPRPATSTRRVLLLWLALVLLILFGVAFGAAVWLTLGLRPPLWGAGAS